MSQPKRPVSVVTSEDDTIKLGKLLLAVATEQPITADHRRFAAALFLKFDDAAKAQQANTPRPGIRPSITSIQHTKKRR